MTQKLRRWYGRGDLPFITFSCQQRLASLGTAQSRDVFVSALEGRFWHRRFYDFNAYSAKKRREKLEYMCRNPVARKIARHPGEWRWSSYTSYCGRGAPLVEVDFVK